MQDRRWYYQRWLRRHLTSRSSLSRTCEPGARQRAQDLEFLRNQSIQIRLATTNLTKVLAAPSSSNPFCQHLSYITGFIVNTTGPIFIRRASFPSVPPISSDAGAGLRSPRLLQIASLAARGLTATLATATGVGGLWNRSLSPVAPPIIIWL